MKCKQCTEELVNKREDAIFCNPNCKQKYFKRKKQILSKIKRLEKFTQMEQDVKEHFTKEIVEIQGRVKNNCENIRRKVREAEESLSEMIRTRRLTDAEFYTELIAAFKITPHKYWHDLQIIRGYDQQAKSDLVHHYRVQFKKQENLTRKKYLPLKQKLNAIEAHIKSGEHTDNQEKLNIQISKCTDEIKRFQVEIEELKSIDLDRLEPKPSVKRKNRPAKRTSVVRAYSGKEILNMEFDVLQLDGELGRFLGKLQRERCAIALTGNSGAGKTTFSYQLAKGFLEKNQSVAYFSLESGFTESTKNLVSKYGIGKYKFDAFAEGTLTDVRIEANNYDCIIVDSYAKISSRPQDFEQLRQDFPNTFFIIIFQKTTDGKIRGGSSILYNSTATIDIQITKGDHRIAWMQKSRYDSENFVFSLNRNKVLKSDKKPIKWSEIEEKWMEK